LSKGVKDVAAFILFEALTAYITAHSWLQAASSGNSAMQTQVIFYTILLSLNWIALILIFMHYQDTRNLVNYVENLSSKDGIMILLAIIGVFVFAAVISRPWTTTAIYVPTFAQINLDFVHFDITLFIMTVLTNFALVANSEETTKLVGHNALYLYLASRYPENDKYNKWASVLAPISFWSVLHAYVAYVGPLVWQLVLAAWAAGMIIFAVLYKTQSLLAAVTVHGTYNVIVITATGMGWLMLTPGALAFYIGYAIVNLTLLIITIRQKKALLQRRP
jgi:hypothetical protein